MHRRILFIVSLSTLIVVSCATLATWDRFSESSDPATLSPTPPRGCHSVRAEVVNPILGLTTPDPIETKADRVTLCAYTKGNGPASAVIRFLEDTVPKEFAENRQGAFDAAQTVDDLKDLGDEAYVTTTKGEPGKGDLHTLATRKGRLEIQIVSSAPLEKQIELTRLLLG